MTVASGLLHTARKLTEDATRVVVLSGAGMSAESGVPTFRDAQTGLWERYSPEQLATEEAFRAEPDLVWSWYLWRARMVRACEPNAGHRALGVAQHRCAERGGSLQVVTQNVDDLHERGGAEVLAHLHGSLFEYRCADCDAPAEFDPGTAEAGHMGTEEDLEKMLRTPPPICSQCAHGTLRPGIVWFGEMLPMDAFSSAQTAVEQCDLALVVGTSGLVQPAASLPYRALGSGAAVVEINPEATPLSDDATVTLRGTAAELLPELLLDSSGALS
ncbi:NAD-dependent deacylase [Citricoccus muralis]|uniref:NAD-dependent protein deacylase n=1 Tax=Citricoccus muralis TaxID=169134 RepID=A0ABY8H9L4_9MICC|nr:NAD-dependent deacylase [Citricoccus muralis]WFP17519.1 NAD-dependent deacylase [Citricoccus muralis]